MKNGVFAEGKGQWFTDYWLEEALSFLGILRQKISRCKMYYVLFILSQYL